MLWRRLGLLTALTAWLTFGLTGCIEVKVGQSEPEPKQEESGQPPPAAEEPQREEPAPSEPGSSGDETASRSVYGQKISDYSLDMSDHLLLYSDGMSAAGGGDFAKGEELVRKSIDGMEETTAAVNKIKVSDNDPELKALHGELTAIFEGYLGACKKGLEGLEKKDARILNEGTREMNDLNLRLTTLTEQMEKLLSAGGTTL